MDAHTIKHGLNAQAEEFARWLFPAGKKNGNEWQVGSLAGEAGKSLSIRISGDKVGVFKDFARDGDSGDNLIELVVKARNISFVDALCVCGEWLGDSVADFHAVNKAPARQPKTKPQVRYGSDVYGLTEP